MLHGIGTSNIKQCIYECTLQYKQLVHGLTIVEYNTLFCMRRQQSKCAMLHVNPIMHWVYCRLAMMLGITLSCCWQQAGIEEEQVTALSWTQQLRVLCWHN